MPIREIISGYGSPIIAGLTPFSTTMIDPYREIRTPDWPPYIDEQRLAAYDQYTALIENEPWKVFESLRLQHGEEDRIVLAAALPELLATVWADAVWTDPPQIEFESDSITDRWTAIDEANDFTEQGAFDSVFAAAGWGTSVLKLRRDNDRATRLGLDSDVVIEEIDPGIFFPVLRRGSARDIESVVLAWSEQRPKGSGDGEETWQVRELHEIDGGRYTIETQERRAENGSARNAFRRVKFEQPEGVDFLPFVDLHGRRWRGRYWGVSELSRNLSLFDEIDATLSSVAEILDYHGSPMLQVPASVIYGGTLTKAVNKTMGIRRPEEADIARYITFDGMISDQVAHLDKLIELALFTAEVPRAYFGLGDLAAVTTGVALRLQLQNYLKKADRWQRAETSRLKRLLPMALRLDGQAAGLVPKITHGSPLPADDEQTARIESMLYQAKMTSLRLALKKLRRVGSEPELDDEMAAIEDEREASIAALPAPMQANVGGNSSTDPNDGDGPAA